MGSGAAFPQIFHKSRNTTRRAAKTRRMESHRGTGVRLRRVSKMPRNIGLRGATPAGLQKPSHMGDGWAAPAGFQKAAHYGHQERGRGLLSVGVFGGPHPVGLFGGVTFGGVASCGAFGWARPQFRFGPAHVAVPSPAQINLQTRLPMQSVPGAPHLGGRLSDKICRSCRPLQKNHTKYDEIVK